MLPSLFLLRMLADSAPICTSVTLVSQLRIPVPVVELMYIANVPLQHALTVEARRFDVGRLKLWLERFALRLLSENSFHASRALMQVSQTYVPSEKMVLSALDNELACLFVILRHGSVPPGCLTALSSPRRRPPHPHPITGVIIEDPPPNSVSLSPLLPFLLVNRPLEYLRPARRPSKSAAAPNMSFLQTALSHGQTIKASYKPNTGECGEGEGEGTRTGWSGAVCMTKGNRARHRTPLYRQRIRMQADYTDSVYCCTSICPNSHPASPPAVTDWIERLCTSSYQLTEYEGVPELVESINLQATG